MKNAEGYLEVKVFDAEFPKKSSSFKLYFEFIISGKSKKTEHGSGKNPKWKEKLVMEYTSDLSLTFKLYEKKTLRKDSILHEESLDLIELKQKHKQEAFVTIMSKNRIKGTLRIVLYLYPFTLTPVNICPNLEEETLLKLSEDPREQIYLGKLLTENKMVKMNLASFDNSSNLQVYTQKINLLYKIKVPGSCQIIEVFERSTETSLYCLTLYEHKSENLLFKEILKRQESGKFWTENEIIKFLKAFVDLFVEYEKNNLYFGEINPLRMAVEPFPCVITPGIYYKTTENPDFSENLASDQEWRVPYLSPQIMENYILSSKKFQVKQQNWLKSDVFSLGLVFLHMASLKSPVGLNDLEFRLTDRISNEIESLRYSVFFKGLLTSMLTSEEKGRIDFSTLLEHLNKFTSLI